MIRKSLYISVILLFVSCQFFELEKKSELEKKPIAQVDNVFLYKEDILKLIPQNLSNNDSVLLVKNIINNWAIQQLLIKKADENLTRSESETYTALVQDYKNSLLINGYKEKLIKQRLDTLFSEDEVAKYYELQRANFRLNEELIKIKYLHFGNDVLERERIIDLFKSDRFSDLLQLEKQVLNFKAIHLNDSTWIKVDDVRIKFPKITRLLQENLLKKTKFIQKEDSLGLYLVSVKDVLQKNDIAPLHYISPTIKQLILHKRKLELIREIEKTLLKDAIQNKNFKEY